MPSFLDNLRRFGGPDTPSRQSSLYIRPEFEHSTMTERQLYFDDRIRTIALVVIASGVVYAGMLYLHTVLIPFFLALALKYLLVPLIDFLSCRGQPGCFCRCPRPIAVVLSFGVAILLIILLGLLIVRSITEFTSHTEKYEERVEELAAAAFGWPAGIANSTNHTHIIGDLNFLKESALDFLQDASLGSVILSLLGTAAHIAENVVYIVLFLVFMLAHGPDEDLPVDAFTKAIDRQVFVYIRGKGFISLFVAVTHATMLALVGLDLFMAFGVLSFFLNFIPNIGMFTSLLLPMPLVALDPAFDSYQVAFAFFGPLVTGTFAKDVLEPLILGGATKLHPVAVLLAILIFGSVWGVTGMVMAVPMTGVLRIYLAAVDHPLSQYVANVMGGIHQPAPSPLTAPNTGSTVGGAPSPAVAGLGGPIKMSWHGQRATIASPLASANGGGAGAGCGEQQQGKPLPRWPPGGGAATNLTSGGKPSTGAAALV